MRASWQADSHRTWLRARARFFPSMEGKRAAVSRTFSHFSPPAPSPPTHLERGQVQLLEGAVRHVGLGGEGGGGGADEGGHGVLFLGKRGGESGTANSREWGEGQRRPLAQKRKKNDARRPPPRPRRTRRPRRAPPHPVPRPLHLPHHGPPRDSHAVGGCPARDRSRPAGAGVVRPCCCRRRRRRDRRVGCRGGRGRARGGPGPGGPVLEGERRMEREMRRGRAQGVRKKRARREKKKNPRALKTSRPSSSPPLRPAA